MSSKIVVRIFIKALISRPIEFRQAVYNGIDMAAVRYSYSRTLSHRATFVHLLIFQWQTVRHQPINREWQYIYRITSFYIINILKRHLDTEIEV